MLTTCKENAKDKSPVQGDLLTSGRPTVP